jgi:hypothetical protein
MNHTVHFNPDLKKSFVVSGTGGWNQRNTNTYIKACLEFDISNRKFHIVGHLNTPRKYAGVVSTQDYLYVFGGEYDNFILSTSFERLALKTNGVFEEITVENESILQRRTSWQNNRLLSF